MLEFILEHWKNKSIHLNDQLLDIFLAGIRKESNTSIEEKMV
jgi:hypothetical protein